MLRVFTFVILLSNLLFGQLVEITKFPLQNEEADHLYSSILEIENGEYLFFWREEGMLKCSKSNDGINWDQAKTLVDSLSSNIQKQDFTAYRLKSGKILVAFKNNTYHIKYFYITSSNNGETWSNPMVLEAETINHYPQYYGRFSQTKDGMIYFIFSRTHYLSSISSNDDGITWQNEKKICTGGKYGSIISTPENLLLIYTFGERKILYKKSYDNGITWGDSVNIVEDSNINTESTAVKSSNGKIVVCYKSVDTNNVEEIKYITSKDNDTTWSIPEKFTEYLGVNTNPVISMISEKVYISFVSDRDHLETNFKEESAKHKIWYGELFNSKDEITPPKIYYVKSLLENDKIIITAKVADNNSVNKVFLRYKVNDEEKPLLEMYDNGLSSDGQNADSIYGISISGFSEGDIIHFSIIGVDDLGNRKEIFGDLITFNFPNSERWYSFELNRLKVSMNNYGAFGKYTTDEEIQPGMFDGETILYSGGFVLSGLDNNEVWTNVNFPASRTEDFIPGRIGSLVEDPRNLVYSIDKSDEEFGSSWQLWKYAVEYGAEFYDGNEDGEYTPIDLNENGRWDSNEDKPLIIGDVTTWTVFNDGKDRVLRRIAQDPKQIEIAQTAFAYSETSYEELDGVIFIRYKIENKNSADYDSVYFSLITDPDIGDYDNDLIGCDTNLNAGYCYDIEKDEVYGNSPVFMKMIMQGVPEYIVGKTFIDNNENNIFDELIDTALDTAYIKYGDINGGQIIIGAQNQETNSFFQYITSMIGDPIDQNGWRNYQMGLSRIGEIIDPCEWYFGNMIEVPGCDTINPSFMYSGNPVNETGWINTEGLDQRMILSTGPFMLKQNEPVEIIAAYVAGRGTSSLESINKTKKIAKDVIGFYQSNFAEVPVGVKQSNTEQLPTQFSLDQNYPNPFNPSTTIRYSIPTNVASGFSLSNVRLIVFDILGRELVTLVNKPHSPGNYVINFNASKYSSGVYYYQLKVGDPSTGSGQGFIQTKKMILLK